MKELGFGWHGRVAWFVFLIRFWPCKRPYREMSYFFWASEVASPNEFLTSGCIGFSPVGSKSLGVETSRKLAGHLKNVRSLLCM